MDNLFSQDIPELLQKHLDHLLSSAISIDVIKERGYQTAMGRKILEDAGFSPAQRRAPGILMPMYGPDGTSVGFQYRPDRPRENKNGKIIKYENPTGSSIHLDVPPRCIPHLGNPSVDLYITEGIKKVDALATAGACAIGLTGVWGFKGKNPFGGTTILADFDYITFKGRECYLIFDSDLSSNNNVRMALDRFRSHLIRRLAKVNTLFLPSGLEGEKIGVDDYLTQGKNLDELKTLPRVPPEPSLKIRRSYISYDVVDGVICWMKPTSEGLSEVPLCNFNARVTEDIMRDNGLETSRFFKIVGQIPNGKTLPEIETSATNFNNLNWVTSEWGMKAIIAAGQSSKDRLREAIQLQSRDARQRVVYTHTGWREIDGEMYFLSGQGAMGREDIEVELDSNLQRYQLLEPTDDPTEAIKKSLNFQLVAPPDVTVPLWSAIYLAPLSEIIDTAFTLWLVGPSGSYKSTLTALALCHFGTFDARHLPTSWRDTQNTLERLLFTCKDLPLVIDDWAPGQDSSRARELEVKAEYVVRAQGNRQGRQRMRSDTSIRAGYIPRGLLITSGEQLLGGHSHTARIYSLEIERDDIDTTFMGAAQDEQYYYCASMSHYIAWLKSYWHHLQDTLPRQWRKYRDSAQESDRHPRLPEVIAGLYCSLELVTEYALEYKAITDAESRELRDTGWKIFCKLASLQASRVEEERPGKRAMELWHAMLDQGAAVLWSKEDDHPRQAALGTISIGWRDNSNGVSTYLLNPKAAYGALVQYGQRIGQPFTFKEDAVWKDLKRLGYSECQGSGAKYRVQIYGQLQYVIKLKNI